MNFSELERLAEASRVANHDERGPDEAFQEALHPEVVLELIAENKALAEFKEHMAQLRETHGFESWAAALVEVDRLRGQIEQYAAASMNVSGFGEAFYQVAERLGVTGARPVSPMQVFASEVLPALDKALKDAERYRWLRDQEPNSLTLGRNSDHSSNYMKASEWIEENPEWFHGTPEAVLASMADTDTIWQLQVYPHTPVGFNVTCRATLDDLIDSAMSDEGRP